jgi:hypothetical protein
MGAFNRGSLRKRGQDRGQSIGTSCRRRCGHVRREYASCRHRRVMQPTAVRLPGIREDTRAGAALDRGRFRRTPLAPRVGAITVVVTPEREELHLQIGSRPEQRGVQAFPPNRANESLNEWIPRPRHERRRERQAGRLSPADAEKDGQIAHRPILAESRHAHEMLRNLQFAIHTT